MTKFLRLRRVDQWLLLRAFVIVFVVRAALRVVGFRTVRSWLNKLESRPYAGNSSPDMSQVTRIIWAVNVTSDFLFSQRPCLTKALVAQMLLAREAYPTKLCIGVRRTPDRQLHAHAWLERDGQVVIGHLPNLHAFTPLPGLELKQS